MCALRSAGLTESFRPEFRAILPTGPVLKHGGRNRTGSRFGSPHRKSHPWLPFSSFFPPSLIPADHLIKSLLGCNHEDTKSVIDGNSVVKSPSSGPTPNVINCRQKATPSSP